MKESIEINTENNNLLIKKYDSNFGNYYFVENNNTIKIISLDGKEASQNRNASNKETEKGKLFLQLFNDYDVTAFAAWIDSEIFFDNINDDGINKKFCFISENAFKRLYYSKFNQELIKKINEEIDNFYANKELQLKYNFIILHPICFEIDDNNMITYRSLNTINSNLMNQFINGDMYFSRLINFLDNGKTIDLKLVNETIKEINRINKNKIIRFLNKKELPRENQKLKEFYIYLYNNFEEIIKNQFDYREAELLKTKAINELKFNEIIILLIYLHRGERGLYDMNKKTNLDIFIENGKFVQCLTRLIELSKNK